MGKSCHNDVLDAPLDLIRDLAGVSLEMALCSAQPTTYAQATGALKLAQVALDAPDVSAPTQGDQDFNGLKGRKITIAAKAGITTADAGDATHVALVDTVTERLLYVTPCPTETIAFPGTKNVSAWSIEFGPPQ